MAIRFKQGSLKKVARKEGKAWVLRVIGTNPETGEKVERTPIFVGYLTDFPTKSSAKEEVNRRGLVNQLNFDCNRGKAKIKDIAEHYIAHELLSPIVVKPKSHNTIQCYAGNIRRYPLNRWGDCDWENNQIHIRRTWSRGRIGIPKTKKSKAPVAMAPLLGRYLRAWRSETVFAADSDWVFASNKTKGRTPRVGNMLAAHYLRPAALKAGALITTSEKRLDKEGREIIQLQYWDKQGNDVRRFGFHNLRHSLASFLTTEKKSDIKTVQRSLRHAKSTTTLDKYVQTDMDELVAAQELLLGAIFQNQSGALN